MSTVGTPGTGAANAPARRLRRALALGVWAISCGCMGPVVSAELTAEDAPSQERVRAGETELRSVWLPPIYFQGQDFKVLFPLAYSVGPPGRQHRGIVPLAFWGPGYFVSPPLLPLYLRTKNARVSPMLLSGSWSKGPASITIVGGPLWVSYRPAPGAPLRFQLLGGLVARDCNYVRGTYRYRILWLIPIGRPRQFTPPPAAEE